MSKEKIPTIQAIGLAAFVLTANPILIGGGKAVGQDVWISALIIIAIMVPLAFMYRRILVISKGKSFSAFAEETMGKVLGRIFITFIVLYSLLLGIIMLRSFSEFLFIAALTRTPQYIMLLLMGVLCIWTAKCGMTLISRWAYFAYPILTTVVLLLTILSLTVVDWDNLRPILFKGFTPVLSGAWNMFTFPMIEATLLLIPFSRLKKRKDAAKIYISAIVVTSIIMIIIVERNILIMGEALTKAFYFPSYKEVGILRLGRFFDRLEILRGMGFVAGAFLKSSYCLYISSLGINSMLGLKEDETGVTAPVGLLMVALAGSLFSTYSELVAWLDRFNGYVAVACLGLIPIIIWITAEIKIFKKKSV